VIYIRTASSGEAHCCYFRTLPDNNGLKALIQITEKCNLSCEHCFVCSSSKGKTITIDNFLLILHRLTELNVNIVTLTGGEPFLHPDILEITRLLVENNIKVGICTNGTLINLDQINEFAKIGNIHINVSLDGFGESHDLFRHSTCVNTVKNAIINLSEHGLLQGILVTPNIYAEVNEYKEICLFAKQYKAKYVLINPLSEFGRGIYNKRNSGVKKNILNEIYNLTKPLTQDGFEINYVRFPSLSAKLSSCNANNIIYVYANGEISICPYIVFSAKHTNSK